jgi:hypothetical protein
MKPGQHKHNIELYTLYITLNVLKGSVAYTSGDVEVRSPLGLFFKYYKIMFLVWER